MASTPQVGVVGLNALVRDVKRMEEPSGPLLKAMRDAGRHAATPVADAARGAVPHVSGTLAGDIRVTAANSGATVRMGRVSVPYAGPVEFGGWPPGRAYLPQGRYLYPAAGRVAAEAASLYSAALEQVFATYPWTNQGTDPGGVHD